MRTVDVIRSQYVAALDMLGDAIRKCPESLWNAKEVHPTWRLAYHALFYTHLYLQPRIEDFAPWDKHHSGYENLGKALDAGAEGAPYGVQDLLAYLDLCRDEVDAQVPDLDLDAASGFGWLPFGKLELQFYSIRHLQHHAGQLADRLRTRAGIGVGWVGARPSGESR
jgi:hypothetical protein